MRFVSGIRVCVEDARDGIDDAVPFVEQTSEDLLALGGEKIKPLVAFVFFAPLAGQKALRFEAAEKRIKRAFVDLEAAFGKLHPERESVVLLPELGENGES